SGFRRASSRRSATAGRCATATSRLHVPRRVLRMRLSSAICTTRTAAYPDCPRPRAAITRSKSSIRGRPSHTCDAACQERLMAANETDVPVLEPLPVSVALRRVTQDILATLEWRAPSWFAYWAAVGLCFFISSLALLVWAYQI